MPPRKRTDDTGAALREELATMLARTVAIAEQFGQGDSLSLAPLRSQLGALNAGAAVVVTTYQLADSMRRANVATQQQISNVERGEAATYLLRPDGSFAPATAGR